VIDVSYSVPNVDEVVADDVLIANDGNGLSGHGFVVEARSEAELGYLQPSESAQLPCGVLTLQITVTSGITPLPASSPLLRQNSDARI